MTSREIQLVRETFQQTQPAAGPLSQLFYGRIFQINPSLRGMFHGDIRAQGLKFTGMLTTLIDGLERLDRHVPELKAMGQRHVAYGVVPEHYDVVCDSLLWALSQAVEGGLTGEQKAAWKKMLEEVSAVMLEGAAQLSNG